MKMHPERIEYLLWQSRKELIKNGIEGSITSLNGFVEEYDDKDITFLVNQIQVRYKEYKKKKIKGIIGLNEGTIEENKITSSILELIDEIEKESKVRTQIKPIKQNRLIDKIGLTKRKVILNEEFFDGGKQWNLGLKYEDNIKKGRVTVRGNSLVVEHYQGTGFFEAFRKINLNNKSNFEIEARVTALTGNNQAGYSLIWGNIKDGCVVGFGINPSEKGHFYFYNMPNHKFLPIATGVRHKSIIPGPHPNTIHVKKSDRRFLFYINGSLVYEYGSIDFYGNEIGFSLTRNISISVEFIRVQTFR